MAGYADFGTLAENSSHFLRIGREHDPPLFIDKPDYLDICLPGGIFHYLVDFRQVIQHHLVIGCPDKCLTQPLRTLHRIMQQEPLDLPYIQVGIENHRRKNYQAGHGNYLVGQAVMHADYP